MPGYQHTNEAASAPNDAAPPHRKDAVDRRLETLLSAIYGAPEPPAAPEKARSEASAVPDEAQGREPESVAPPKRAQLPPPGRTSGVSLLLGAAIVFVAVMVPFLPRISVGPNDVRIGWPSGEQTAAMASSNEARQAPPILEATAAPPPLVEKVADQTETPPVAPSAGDVASNAGTPQSDSEPRASELVAMTPPQTIAPAPPVEMVPARDPAPTLAPAEPSETNAPQAPAEAAIPADPPALPAAPAPNPTERTAAVATAAAAPAQFLVQFGAFRNEAIGQKDCADFAKLAATRLVRSSKGEDTWYLCRTDAPRSRDEAKAVLALAASSGKSGILVEVHPAR